MKWRLLALIVGAALVLAGAVIFAGVGPLDALRTLMQGSLGSGRAITGTLRETTPLLVAGLAVFVALRAGLFNIGVEGQLLVGAAASAAVALTVGGIVGILLSVVAGIVAGALWALPAGWIRAYRNGHEVITTIMLNNVALYLAGWLLSGPLKDPKQESPTTALIDKSVRLPTLLADPVGISSALVFGVLLSLGMAWWFQRTVAGYEHQAAGANPSAARLAGVDPRQVMMRAMVTSGGIGGLAGALQVLAYEGRFYAGFSPGYGFDALGVALLAGSSALGVLPSSLLFGILAKGGTALQIEGVPKGITTVALGFLILIAAAIRFRQVRAA